MAVTNRTYPEIPIDEDLPPETADPTHYLRVIQTPTTIDLDGATAQVLFPVARGIIGLREDIFDPDLGMPRDHAPDHLDQTDDDTRLAIHADG